MDFADTVYDASSLMARMSCAFGHGQRATRPRCAGIYSRRAIASIARVAAFATTTILQWRERMA
eukprot:scaffold264745_cov36-Tisochrysis_lutea.AAC.1